MTDPTEQEEGQRKAPADEPTATWTLATIIEGETERGIPLVKFLPNDVGAFLNEHDWTLELLMGAYSELFGKFKSYETSLQQKRATFLEKIPEIEKTITLIERLEQSSQDEPLVAHYSLADAVFAKAQVDTSVNKVYLWLGANVMLEYEYQEARELLEHKLAAAKKDLNEILEDLTVCRNQIVTAEVCVSRIYNWDVRQKRLEASRKK